MSPSRTAEPAIAPVVWHDLECGSYSADLELWRKLADHAAAPGEPCHVLDLGCGTGRVALDLAAHGHRVTGLDSDADLVAELRRRAARRNVPAGAVIADARTFDLGLRFDLVLAAMQFLQLMRRRDERAAVLSCVRSHLHARGIFAAALLDLSGESTDGDYVPPLPDIRELDGWVWSSQAVEVRLLDRGAAIALDRHRRTVSPTGEISESEDSVRLELLGFAQLEEELRAAGITPIARKGIPPTDDHVGSMVVLGKMLRD
jgi:SAM-dependent methyltransferase